MTKLLTTLIILAGSTIIFGCNTNKQCKNNDLCCCLNFIDDEYEFQCPKSDSSVIIHTVPGKRMLVVCNPMKHLDLEISPNYTAGNIDYLGIKYCPLPKEGLLQLFMQKFRINKLTSLEIVGIDSEYSSVEDINIDYFRYMSSLKKLKIELKNITLHEDFLQYLPNLTRLDLDGSNLKEIGYLFKHTPQIVELYLSRNSIKEIPNRLFENLTHLQRLHLCNNQLTILNNDYFKGLKNLRALELSSNRISFIEPNAFSDLNMLVNISLRSNNMGYLSAELFANNSKLMNIYIDNNNNLTLADKCFGYLKDLTTLDMGNSKLKIIPENVFEGSTNIKILVLRNNLLEELPVGVFKDLRKLKELNLASNNIKSLPDGIFSSTDDLVELNMEHNLLGVIAANTFDARNLKKLLLNNNRISTITNSAFNRLDELVHLDLSHNNLDISTEYINPFSVCQKLEELNLQGNKLSTFPYEVLLMVHMKSLNLSQNRISEISILQMIALSTVHIDLTLNNISAIDFSYVSVVDVSENRSLTTVDLEHNVLICDCRNLGLIRYLNGDFPVLSFLNLKLGENKCAEPKSFQNIKISELKPINITCPYMKKGCPSECQCFERPFDGTVVVDCASRNLTDWPLIGFNENKVELNLTGNMLTHSPNVSRQYNNITNLFLSNNRLEKIEWVPTKIQVLKLDGNNLAHIEFSLLNQLTNFSALKDITLTNNPWTCDCSAYNLQNFIRANPNKVNQWTNVLCEDDKEPLMNKKVLCSQNFILQIVLPILVFVLIIVVFMVIYTFYKEEIILILDGFGCIPEEELDQDKEYDIFLSYSHKDEDFVIQNLLPVLEDGSDAYKICIHVRDFLPGETIATQVANSVQNSRRTLVVLSNNFQESGWGKLEFKLAHTQGIEEGRARLVVIKYGNLNEEKLGEDMKMYLKTNTYVEWGNPWFWKKLRYVLPHAKGKKLKKLDQRHANMMLKIDDKYVLSVPPLTQPESTPPVMVVDPTQLRNNQLNFKKVGIETSPVESPMII